MGKNPWDALNDLNVAGNAGAEAAAHENEAAAATEASPVASPADDATRQRAREVAEGFKAHKEKRRRTAGKGDAAQPSAVTAPQGPQAQNRPAAKTRPGDNPQAAPEDLDRERRRKRTNWKLRENAMTVPDPEGQGPVKNRPRVADEPMRFEIDRSKPESRKIPSAIPNEELQKAGWSAERFAEHEEKTEEAMAARGERLRGKILAELDAITRDARAEIERPVEPTGRQAEDFAHAVSRAAGETAPPELARRAANRAARTPRSRQDVPRPTSGKARGPEASETPEIETTGVSAPSGALAAAGVTPTELEASHRANIAEMQRLNPGWKSATGLDAGQGAERDAAAGSAPEKKSPRKASVVWSPADSSAARLAGYRLEKQGLRGAELASALPAERRRRAEAIRKAAAANLPTGAAPSAQVGDARNKRQPILRDVPGVPSPAAPEPIDPEVLARDAASIRRQRDVAAAEIRAARDEWKAEAGGEARADTLAALDKKIEERRKRAPKKNDGENVRAAVAAVAATAGSGRASGATEVGLTEPGSFENFYAVLRARTPSVVGGAQEYSADEIIEIVEAIRRGEPGIGAEHLTRTLGIREAAVRLIEAERLERARAALGIVAATPAGAPATPVTEPTVARPRLVAADSGAGSGAGAPPPPTGGPANVPPTPGGRQGPAGAPTPRAATARATSIFDRASQGAKQLGVGTVGMFNQFVVEPMSWLWKKAERPGSYNTKEAPFKNQTSIFYPITGSIGALWKIIGGWFGAKFETPKEEKKK